MDCPVCLFWQQQGIIWSAKIDHQNQQQLQEWHVNLWSVHDWTGVSTWLDCSCSSSNPSNSTERLIRVSLGKDSKSECDHMGDAWPFTLGERSIKSGNDLLPPPPPGWVTHKTCPGQIGPIVSERPDLRNTWF